MNVEMPDGTIIEDVPEGMTQGEVLRRYEAAKKAPAADTRVRRAPLDTEVKEWKPPSTVGYTLNETNRMLSGLLGFPVDAINAGLNAIGLGSEKPFGGSKFYQGAMGVKNLTPGSPEAKIAGTIVPNIAASVPFAGWAARGGRVMPAVTELAAGAGAGVGATVAQEAVPNSKAAEVAGQLIGSVLPYRAGGAAQQVSSLIADRQRLGQQLRGQAEKATESSARFAAGTEIERALAPYDPKDIERQVSVYERLRQRYPGIKIGAGEITDIDPLLSMQREAAGRSVETLAEAGARARKNAAIAEGARGAAVPEVPKNLQTVVKGLRGSYGRIQHNVDDALSAVAAEEAKRKEAIVGRALPQSDVGETLGAIRGTELKKSREVARQKYDAFRTSLGEQADAPADAKSILDEISALRAEDPAAQRMPSLFTTVGKISTPGAKTKADPFGPAGAAGVTVPETGPTTLTINDLLSIQKAVGKDVRTNMMRQPPDRELTRRLMALDNEVTAAIKDNAPQEAMPLYDEARRFYREEHVPRFFRGANYKQALPDAYGDLRIQPEKIVSTYLNSPSNAVRFGQLYGGSQKARAALYGGTLDLYRQEVLAGGKTHEAFMRKYEGAMSKLPWLKDVMEAEGGALRALAETQQTLRENAAAIAKTRLAKILNNDTPDAVLDAAMKSPQNMGNFIVRMGKEDRGAVVTAVMDRGWNILKQSGTESFERWLAENKNTIRTAMFGAYGKKSANEFMTNIDDVVQLTKYVERSPIQKIDVGAVRTADDPLREKLGFSSASVFAALRGIAQKRVSPHFAAGVFGGQFITNVTKQKYYDMLRQVLYEPETLNAFVNSARSGANPADFKEWTSRMVDLSHTILGREVPANLAKKLPTYGQLSNEDEEDE